MQSIDSLPPVERDRIRQAYEAGSSAAIIAEATGIPVHRVRIYLDQMGVTLVPAARTAKTKHLDRIRELLDQGATARQIADQIEVPHSTVVRWLRQEGLSANTLSDQRADGVRESVLADYRAGSTLKQISARHGIGKPTIVKWAQKAGISRKPARSPRKKLTLMPRVLELHRLDKTVTEIAQEVGVHWTTVGRWLRQDGCTPIHQVAQAKAQRTRRTQKEEVLATYLSGESVVATAKKHNVHRTTVIRWVNEAGVRLQGGSYLRQRQEMDQAVRYYEMGMSIEGICESLDRSYQTVRGYLDDAGVRVRTAAEQRYLGGK